MEFKKLYQSKYVVISISKELSIVQLVWTIETENMIEEEFLQEIETFIKFAKNHDCKAVFADATSYLFAITPEAQIRFDKRIIPQYIEAGFVGIAFLSSKEYITQISLELIVDEPGFQQIPTKFFDNKQKAFDWLQLLLNDSN